jgi:hypothetical protein
MFCVFLEETTALIDFSVERHTLIHHKNQPNSSSGLTVHDWILPQGFAPITGSRFRKIQIINIVWSYLGNMSVWRRIDHKNRLLGLEKQGEPKPLKPI